MNLSNIGAQQVKHLATGTVVELNSFWQNQTCVVIFFRRWGCMMCRLYAKQLSEIYPRLQENNVNMIGVGCEELGGQEFLNGKFFSGELYYDFNKTIYREMGFKRFNFLSILASLLWPDSRKVISEARALQVPGNFAGDGLQTGGALIVDKGGKLLYEFKQNGPGDHLPNNKILQILGLSEVESADGTIKQAECDDVQCTK